MHVPRKSGRERGRVERVRERVRRERHRERDRTQQVEPEHAPQAFEEGRLVVPAAGRRGAQHALGGRCLVVLAERLA